MTKNWLPQSEAKTPPARSWPAGDPGQPLVWRDRTTPTRAGEGPAAQTFPFRRAGAPRTMLNPVSGQPRPSPVQSARTMHHQGPAAASPGVAGRQSWASGSKRPGPWRGLQVQARGPPAPGADPGVAPAAAADVGSQHSDSATAPRRPERFAAARGALAEQTRPPAASSVVSRVL